MKKKEIVTPAETPGKPGPKPKLVMSETIIHQLKALGKIRTTVEEAAAVLGCSLRTLQNFFTDHPEAKEAHEDGKLSGLVSLRRAQFALAEKNPGMAIWLGKQLLGQREPVQQVETGKPGDFSGLTDDELDKELRATAQALAESDPSFVHELIGKRPSRTKH